MTTSPTQLSLKWLRQHGFKAEVVEKWIPRANVRKDLFGCIDIVAIHAEQKLTLGVQVTSYSNMAARKKKAEALEDIKTWLQVGNQFVIHGWQKKNNRWILKQRPFEM